uniref:Reverse transcriptase domain-containing protein n=1 Tax=Tanacetum cinerariifolium TaxID=118510 RepID=A0A6L2LLY7_TANCI|nr:reverse transcriptase domain-containing protein [Tanacetum cinerariifolium]
MGPSIPIYPKKKTEEHMVDSQPMEKEIRGAKARDVRTKNHEGPTELVLYAPRILAYGNSDKEAPARSLARGFFDRFSLESSGTSDTHRQTRSANKSQRTPSKNKEPAHLRRSRRLKDQSITKEKTRSKKSKSREKIPDTKKQAQTPNMRKDHLGIFLVATEQEEWPMPVWCKMFRQTLGEATRNWFDDLDSKSVDSFDELSQKFVEEYSQQNRYAKDPTEIHGIKRRQNEGLQAFMDRFKSESSHIQGIPPVLRISAFMHGHGHPKLAKKLNDKIPKTVDKMFETVKAFIRGEVRSQHQQLLSAKKANRGSCGLGEVGLPGKGHPPEQPEERKSRKEQLIPRNQLTDEPIILEGMIEDHSWRQREEQMSRIREQALIRTKGGSDHGPNQGLVLLKKACHKENTEEILIVSQERPNQHVKMRFMLTSDCKRLLTEVLWENIETNLATRRETGIERKGVPLAEGRDNQKGPAPQMGHQYHTCQVNRWNLEGASGLIYPQQKNDEAKIEFHTKEGVYYFTHMPKELKNSTTTLQRMMEKVFTDQRGQSLEVYLEEIVVKSKSEQSLVQDVKETLRKLKRVNIKIDPSTSLFGVEEGKFLGHMVTKEGIRADPDKVQAIIRCPTPKSPNQIRSLFLQLTTIGNFIPKLVELKYPINKVCMRMDAAADSGWTNEAEEDFQRIKIELNKLQTLAIPKEGEKLML